jgi:DNA gyrase subunit A
MELTPIIKESFSQYAGAVLQSRALVDVRDCLKPSARQIFYCLYTDKFIHSKPFKKTLKGIGSAMRMYIHGDSSCEGVIMRAGQPFAMRYPLVEVEGSYGNLMESGNWAAPRYTASRLSDISNYLFEDIVKDTINEWRDNYDDTEQYPAVLPSKGFYNIVNGTMGIGIGMSSSIPQFNLRELNEALIKLLWNPDCSFEDIYCAPDFATGGILLNEEEVKESLKNGNGKSCKLRSVISYDNKERCLIVTEIPYSVYTNTICGELEKILESEENPGIDRFNDLTGSTPLIKIYLSRRANPDKVLKYLYKNTSLQYYYGINMTMLENGRYPKVFTWKEALQSYLNHEMSVYRQGFIFDLNKIKNRIHIIEGLLKAISILDEVIALIKGAADTRSASLGLQKIFGFSEEQAKAILDIKLARLAKLEINKLEKEKNDLEKERDRIENILHNEELLKKEIEKGLQETAKKFGDGRRTKILNIENQEDEPTEIRSLLINLTNQNNIFVSETSSLYSQRRGGVGNKFKLNDGEYVISTLSAESSDTILFFSQVGNFYHYQAGAIPLEEKIPVETLFMIKSFEYIRAITSFNPKNSKRNIIFFTRNGMMKKSLLSEYNIKRAGGMRAIDLAQNDELCSIIFTDEEKVGILTEKGQFLICETKDVRPVGRITKGVKGIKLNEGDFVISAKIITNTAKQIVSITRKGYIKRTPLSEFNVTGRYTKGGKLQKFKDESDWLVDFLPVEDEKEVIIVSTSASIKVKLTDIALLGKNAQGSQSIKMREKDCVVGLSKS